ncbi:SCP2 domain-containing protein [Enterobacteriaceae bacterium ESL0689]|nr:SCP2 domain-containing protein [Enterobacteriaceae bacterium ESL0689]
MPFTPLIAAGIETALNTVLWRDKALKPVRQRLLGKVLRIELKELSVPVVLVFSECQLDILSEWEGHTDCTVITHLSVLPQLRHRQQLMTLIRRGDLQVQGDLQVVQNMATLCDQAEFDLAELLSPYTGDIVAEGISKILHGGERFLRRNIQYQRRHIAEAMTEELRLAPGALEVAWFIEEVAAADHSLTALEKRLEILEGQ